MGFGARKQKGGITGSSGSHNPPSSSSKNGPSQGLLSRRLSGLVVDDNKVNRRVHRMLLSKLGVETQEAENGREAVDLCAAGMVFDLILMDMEMPIMDGPQATRVLRAMGVTSKIVGVTGNSRGEDRDEFMSAGIDAFYVKPITRTALISILEDIGGH
ncbi:two-component response regulator ARR22-like protein isoform X2 [Cinnamomum micranthum f. kanehirae]|uniref:Two-component response regulator ARR22-like protein isoform X2 n=1 Tax=Cinnamomum micranthum f. kanehirae TaxID=337451 RepID=A0A3S3MGA2_9MAGN|nr:two-component response regulator ARR22-like protein isoform X2 [Cinnamomum micranthum f. kanehirae]